MKKNPIHRRDFIKSLSTGILPVALVPSCTWIKNRNENQTGVAFLPKLFDCNKYLGPGFPKIPDYPNVSDLLEHMDRLNIDRTVTWHTSAKENNPMPGNEQLIKEIESAGAKDRIIPSFILSPVIKEDSDVMSMFVNLVKSHNIHAFHFLPGNFGWTLPDVVPVIQEIRNDNPILFLNAFQSLGKIEDIIYFAQEFREVSIVITDTFHAHYSRLFEMMEKCTNIYAETSFLHSYRVIENIIKRFGKERLIFGTGYKSNNGAAIAALAHAEIDSETAQLIAHGNLERLLKIENPLTGFNSVTGDRLWNRLLRKEQLGVDILDAHTHHTRTIAKWVDYDPADYEGHVKHSLKSMDCLGVSTMFIAEHIFYPPDSQEGLTYMEEHMKPYGDRFRGYLCALAFTSEYKEKMIPRLDEIFSRPYYIGFKTHNDHWKIPVTDPCFTPMWEYANAHGLTILLHTWNTKYNAPKMLKDIVARYPNAIFLIGHSGNTDRPDAEELAYENPNVFLEWCGSFLNPADWRETLNRLGNTRLVYGSDGVSWEDRWGHNPAWEMGRLLSMDIPDETLIPVLGKNMRDILSQRR